VAEIDASDDEDNIVPKYNIFQKLKAKQQAKQKPEKKQRKEKTEIPMKRNAEVEADIGDLDFFDHQPVNRTVPPENKHYFKPTGGKLPLFF
jgi:hypothetical protein